MSRQTLTKVLAPRHLQVLALIAQGYSNAEIAGRLYVSESTVKGYVKDINQRLNSRSRAHSVHLAHKYQIPEVVGAAPLAADIKRRTRVAAVKPIGITAEQRNRP